MATRSCLHLALLPIVTAAAPSKKCRWSPLQRPLRTTFVPAVCPIAPLDTGLATSLSLSKPRSKRRVSGRGLPGFLIGAGRATNVHPSDYDGAPASW